MLCSRSRLHIHTHTRIYLATKQKSLSALHFKDGPRKASVIHPRHKHKHTQTHTRAHTSQRPRHSCPDHIPPGGPAFTFHTDQVQRDTWIPLCSPFPKPILKSVGDPSSHSNTNRAHVAFPRRSSHFEHLGSVVATRVVF